MKYYKVPKHIIKQDFFGNSDFEKGLRKDSINLAKQLRGKIPLEIGIFLERVYTGQLRSDQPYTTLVRVTSSIPEADVFKNGARIWGTSYTNTFMKPFSFTHLLGNIVGAEEWKKSDMAIIACIPTKNLDFAPGETQPMYIQQGSDNGIDLHRLLPEFIVGTIDVKDAKITGIHHNPSFTTRHDYSHKGLEFDDTVFSNANCTIKNREEADAILRTGLQAQRDKLRSTSASERALTQHIKISPRTNPTI